MGRTILSAAAGLALLWYAGGSGAQPILATGSDADVTEEGLHRVDPSIMEAAWVRPDLDLSSYTRILLMPTAPFSFAKWLNDLTTRAVASA